jgi:hypothetical protein
MAALRLMQLLAKMQHYSAQLFQIIKEGLFNEQSRVFENNFTIIRMDGIKVLIGIF